MSCETLRVGYVLKKYPRLSETFILNEILGLERAGVDLSIFSLGVPDEGRFHGSLARVKAAATYLPPLRSSSVHEALVAYQEAAGAAAPDALARALRFVGQLPDAKPAVLLLHGLTLAQEVRRRGLDHLHAHFMTVAARVAYLAHLFSGVPFSVTAHAKDIYRTGVSPEVFAEIARAATRVVTVTDSNRRYIADSFLGGDATRIVRIYNGLDRDELLEEGFGSPPRELPGRERGLLLAVGRLVAKKGFDRLLDACAALRGRDVRFRCVVVGDGECREALAEQVARLELGDVVELVGALPRGEVVRLMRQARVLAAPCLTDEDGNRDALPTVLIEALAMGLPIVSTRLNGIPEIADHGRHGLLVEEGDDAAFTDALVRMLTDDGLWQTCSSAATARVDERFDRVATLAELLAVFRGQEAATYAEARA